MLRFRLRTILIATALLAICFAWLSLRVNRNNERRKAVEKIWRMGGSVAFLNEGVFDRPTSASDWASVESRGWVYDAIHTRTAVQIIFANHVGYPSDVDDGDIPSLVNAVEQLPEINLIRLDATRITPDGLVRMRSELPHVNISAPRFDSLN